MEESLVWNVFVFVSLFLCLTKTCYFDSRSIQQRFHSAVAVNDFSGNLIHTIVLWTQFFCLFLFKKLYSHLLCLFWSNLLLWYFRPVHLECICIELHGSSSLGYVSVIKLLGDSSICCLIFQWTDKEYLIVLLNKIFLEYITFPNNSLIVCFVDDFMFLHQLYGDTYHGMTKMTKKQRNIQCLMLEKFHSFAWFDNGGEVTRWSWWCRETV